MDATASTMPPAFDDDPSQYEERVVIAMVGLPARGKSYLSNAIVRHFNFAFATGAGGCPTRLFNPGNVRRKNGLAGVDAGFFDSINGSGKEMRERMAMDCLEDLLGWIERPEGGGCSLGILDATNSTVARRRKIIERVERERKVDPSIKLMFLECISENDEELLGQYYRMKLVNDDYRDTDPEVALADFKRRVGKYEAAYETITDEEAAGAMSYMKYIDAGRRLVCSNVDGNVLMGRVRDLVASINIRPRTIWLVPLVGETEENDDEDSDLTPAGREYGLAVRELIRERRRRHRNTEEASSSSASSGSEGANLTLYTGTLRRYITTAEIILRGDDDDGAAPQCQEECGRLVTLCTANDPCMGDMDSLTPEERKARYSDEMAAPHRADKLTHRYPGAGGESYRDVISRCGNDLLYRLEQTRGDSIVVCDRAVYRVCAGYFLGDSVGAVPHRDVEPGVVLEIRRTEVSFEAVHLPVVQGPLTTAEPNPEPHEN